MSDRLSWLESRRDELVSASVSGMTLGECRDRMRELQSVEREIEDYLAVHVTPGQAESQARTFAYVPAVPEVPPQAGPEPRGPLLSEANMGRYVLTVLAAVLCLLAVCVFVGVFWVRMGPAVRFCLAVAAGTAAMILGAAMRPSGKAVPFWTGVSALGLAILFVAIAAGSAAWGLYPDLLAMVLMLAWFAGGCWAGFCWKSGLFYTVTHIGGLMAVAMACSGGDGTFLSEAVAAVMLMAMFGLGSAGAYHIGSKTTVWCHVVFCWLAGLIATVAFHGAGSEAVMFSLLFGLCSALILTRRLVPRDTAPGIAGAAVLAVIGCGMLALCLPVCASPEFYTAVLAACVPVILICGLNGACGYYIGAAAICAGALAGISFSLTGYEGLFPAVACLILFLAIRDYKPWTRQIALIVFYILSLIICLAAAPVLCPRPIAGIACALMAVCPIVYARRLLAGGAAFFLRPADAGLIAVLPGIALAIPCGLQGYPVSLPFAGILAGLWAYRLWVSIRYGAAPQGIWFAAHAMIYGAFCSYCLGAPCDLTSTAGAIDAILRLECLMLTAVCYAALAFRDKDRTDIIGSLFVANANLRLAAAVFGLDAGDLAIGVAGAAAGALFIWLGFRAQSKPMRQWGLACLILHVLKIALFDVGGDPLARAGALLAGGLICFAVSYAYNRLDGKYGGE